MCNIDIRVVIVGERCTSGITVGTYYDTVRIARRIEIALVLSEALSIENASVTSIVTDIECNTDGWNSSMVIIHLTRR